MRETFGQGADWKRPHAFRVTAAAQQIDSFSAECRAEWPLFNPSMYRAGRQCGAVRLVSRVLQAVERMGCVARRICKAGAHGLKRDGQTCIAVTERTSRTQSINWIEQARRHGPLSHQPALGRHIISSRCMQASFTSISTAVASA